MAESSNSVIHKIGDIIHKYDKIQKGKQSCGESYLPRETFTREIKSLFDEFDWKSLSCCESDQRYDSHAAVLSLLKMFYNQGTIGEFQGKEDVGYVKSDFQISRMQAAFSLTCISALLGLYPNWTGCKSDMLHPLLLVIEHLDLNLWTSDSSTDMAAGVLDKILNVVKCSLVDLLSGEGGLMKYILDEVLPRFSSKNWKCNPSMKQVYRWSLLQLKSPQLSDFLTQLLPPALFLADDHEAENKIVGVKCLSHILDNSSRSELSWFGRDEVIYDTLQKLTHTTEPELVRVLHPALLKVTQVTHTHHKTKAVCRQNEMLQRLLYSMAAENNLCLRRCYSEHLPTYIQVLGVEVVAHFSRLFPVIQTYLAVPDRDTQTNTLHTLKVTLTVAWPRLTTRQNEMIKCLLKLLHVTCTDTQTDVTCTVTRSDLLRHIQDSLVLLRRLDPEPVTLALNSVLDLHCDLHQQTTEVIRNVLNVK